MFKYADFFISLVDYVPSINIAPLNLALPIGISFYTFQTMSYTIDVYRGEGRCRKILLLLVLCGTVPAVDSRSYCSFQTVAEQMDSRKETLDLFKQGVFRFVVGLGKKVLIANQVGVCGTRLHRQK